MAGFVQALAIGRPEHSASTCGQHTNAALAKLGEDRFFEIAESGFPFALKENANRAAYLLLDCVIGISEWDVEPPGEMPPDGRFSGAGEADENNARRPRIDSSYSGLSQLLAPYGAVRNEPFLSSPSIKLVM